MITIYIKSASMTGIMMTYLLHRLQFTNVQKGKTILLPLSCQPRKTFCLGTQHTAAAVSSPVVGDLFTGPGEKVKMADPPFGQSIQPVCHVTFPHQLHVRQKSVPLHRHSGVEIGRTAARRAPPPLLGNRQTALQYAGASAGSRPKHAGRRGGQGAYQFSSDTCGTSLFTTPV